MSFQLLILKYFLLWNYFIEEYRFMNSDLDIDMIENPLSHQKWSKLPNQLFQKYAIGF